MAAYTIHLHSTKKLGSLSVMTRSKNIRSMLYQAALLVMVLSLGSWLFHNLQNNLGTLGQSISFSALSAPAGFPISESLPVPLPGTIEVCLFVALLMGIASPDRYFRNFWPSRLLRTLGLLVSTWFCLRLFWGEWSTLRFVTYSPEESYILALLTGLLNTVKVGITGLVFASILGFALGVARISVIPEFRLAAAGLVHTLRSVPVLLQLIFWYVLILNFLPRVQNSFSFFPRNSESSEIVMHSIYLNNRGLFLPQPNIDGPASLWIFTGLSVVLLLVSGFMLLRLRNTFLPKGKLWGLIPFAGLSLCGLIFAVGSGELIAPTWSFPRLTFGGRNIASDLSLSPEYLALVLGLGIYTASYIAEIVRGGILSVDPGQKEAASALGLSNWQTLKLVVMPQAWRVIIPPLTSQYLNLVKNSSLAVAVGYPDLVGVGGTILNQSGRSLEIILVWMAVFLFLSLSISLCLNVIQTRQKYREEAA